MNDLETIQEKHTAGPIAIGFDYQFYLFMYLLLELTQGQEIGFEVKDDIHIDKADGTTVQFQAKHTVLKNAKGKFKNLTNLDNDLWKSLSNWTEFINSETEVLDYLLNNSFSLITNKGENNNIFTNALKIFKLDNDIDKVITLLHALVYSLLLRRKIVATRYGSVEKVSLYTIKADEDSVTKEIRSYCLSRLEKYFLAITKPIPPEIPFEIDDILKLYDNIIML